jgi:hypothetical protein
MVLLIDDLLLGGFQFVLRRLADAVDSELTDDRVYREELLAAQMKLELGELTEEEFAEIERDLLDRIREVRERQGVGQPTSGLAGGDFTLGGVEVTGPETDEPASGAPPRASARRR